MRNVALIFGAIAAGQDGWTWQNPPPQGNHLNGIWGSSARNIFAVGEAGTIIHSDGTAWSTMSRSITGTLRDAWGSSATNVFAVGFSGTILHYDGTSWTNISSVTNQSMRDIWGSSGSDVFAGWSGASTGMGPCTITRDSGKAVTATFGVEGEVAPQSSTMYYRTQLQVRQGIAAAAAPTATQLAIFTGAPPPGVYLVGVAGTAPYAGPLSAGRLANTLLLGGCAGGPCAAVNCACFSPEGKRTDHVYLPFMRRR